MRTRGRWRLCVRSTPGLSGAWLIIAMLPLVVLPGLAQASCSKPPQGARHLVEGPVQAYWQPVPAPLKVGQPFALRVTLCPEQAVLTKVDARMPDHRHGMNYKPTVQALGGGVWRVEGLLWHMSGRWELQMDVRWQDTEHRLLQSMELP